MSIGSMLGAQQGGMVVGQSGADKVPAMLTAGEFVLRKEAADALGIRTLGALNAADQYFARGGYVHPFGYQQGGFVTPSYFQQGGLVAGSNAQNIAPSAKAGSGGGAITVATTINLSGSGTGSAQRAGQGAGGGMTPEEVTKFRDVITAEIKNTIAREKRPGGTLNPNSR
jgi:hypothetical protein